MGRQHQGGDALTPGFFKEIVTSNAHDIQDRHIKILVFQQIFGLFKSGSPGNLAHVEQIAHSIQNIRFIIHNKNTGRHSAPPTQI